MNRILIILGIIIIILIYGIIKYLVIWYNGSGMWLNLYDNIVEIDELDNLLYHKEIDLLSSEECKELKNIIINNKKKWVCKKVVLYTLGGVSYLGDKVGIDKVYKSNKFMRDLFPNLYENLLLSLKKILKKDVVYKEDGYLPGFHIFGSNFLFRYPIAEFHVDRQHTRNNWDESCDLNKTISFTVPIDLPSDTSGLFIFNADKTCTDRKKASLSKRALVKYKMGKLVLHSGNNYHIMKPSLILKNEYRITLQGHGVLCNNKWYIFW